MPLQIGLCTTCFGICGAIRSIESKKRTGEVQVRFNPNYDLQGQRVQGLFFQSMFGVVTTYAETHSVDVNGIEREVVEACEEYLAILRREAEVIQSKPKTSS